MDFIVYPLSRFVQPKRGDDVCIMIDRESNSEFGSLGVKNNRTIFNKARAVAIECSDDQREPIMIAVRGDENDPSRKKVLSSEIITGGKKHQLAVIFNASLERFCKLDENERCKSSSFCLRMTDRLDEDGAFSERVVFAPGHYIIWDMALLQTLMADN